MGGAQVSSFSLGQVSSLKGKVYIVTGGNAGIGYSIVKGLISKGATVVLASRNADRVHEAVKQIKVLTPNADLYGLVLDVSSFSSIDNFVENIKSQFTQIDGLINNAGILMTPHSKTEQGFEVTLGTNVFGAAYLTNQLLPLIKENANGGRVVFLSSAMANFPKKQQFRQVLLDIGGEKSTAKDTNVDIYAMSKLLDSMYAFELQKRLIAGGHSNIEVYAVDPGLIATNVLVNIDGNKAWTKGFFRFMASFIADTPENGALSSIYAATAPIAPQHRGFTFSPGPKVTQYKWTCKAFTPENCALAYDAINKTMVNKGYSLFL